MLQGSSHLDGPMLRAVKNWGFLLRAIVPPESVPHFEQVLAQAATGNGTV
jgi:hypothetical protein